MERYIIPFEFQGKSHYVFIDKDAARELYLIGKIMPFTDEPYCKEIPFQKVASLDASILAPHSIESTILVTLYKFLQVRGWLAMSN